ncbi:MAG: hypothetical protein ABIT71_02150 [Vicinamibacteraceae bacterium]
MPRLTDALRRLWPVPVLVVLCSAGILVAAAPDPPPSAVVAWARAAEWGTFGNEKSTLILDTTPADVPALLQLLADGSEPKQIAARYALGYGDVSSEAAIRALRADAASDEMRRRGMYIAVMGQRGAQADRAALRSVLAEEPLGGDWSSTQAAGFALGILRDAEAVPALERLVAAEHAGGSSSAGEALRWIRHGPWNVDALPSRTDEDRMIAAALRLGLPRTGGASVFNDEARGGIWILDSDAWRFRAGGRAADGMQVDFHSQQNATGTRGILSLSVYCTGCCGTGYDYVLTRDGKGWRVDGLLHTWIS